jgi:hypothetical protein
MDKLSDAGRKFLNEVEKGDGIAADAALREIPMKDWESQINLANEQAKYDYYHQNPHYTIPPVDISVWNGIKSPTTWETDHDVLYVTADVVRHDMTGRGILWEHVNIASGTNVDQPWLQDASAEIADDLKMHPKHNSVRLALQALPELTL